MSTRCSLKLPTEGGPCILRDIQVCVILGEHCLRKARMLRGMWLQTLQFITVWMLTVRIFFESLFSEKLCFYNLLLQKLRFRVRNKSHPGYFNEEGN